MSLSLFRILDLDFFHPRSRVPDAVVKKSPDPGFRSTTLKKVFYKGKSELYCLHVKQVAIFVVTHFFITIGCRSLVHTIFSIHHSADSRRRKCRNRWASACLFSHSAQHISSLQIFTPMCAYLYPCCSYIYTNAPLFNCSHPS